MSMYRKHENFMKLQHYPQQKPLQVHDYTKLSSESACAQLCTQVFNVVFLNLFLLYYLLLAIFFVVRKNKSTCVYLYTITVLFTVIV